MPEKLSTDTYLHVYENMAALDETSALLLQKARVACADAYAPYSNFYVGAALLLENGQIVTGTNQENASYPSGLCAERVAVFSASSLFPKIPILKIAITARKASEATFLAVTPCGSCRQVLSEYELLYKKPIEVVMEGSGKIYLAPSIEMLLPFRFSGEHIKD